MADYSSISCAGNVNSDANPTFTGIALSGSSGANEFRFCLSTSGATGATASANWPFMPKPLSGATTINQGWVFTADTTGSQILTYDGINDHANVFRWSFSADGNPVTAMQATCFTNSSHVAPSPGVQPPGANNDAFSNGTTESNNNSLIKVNYFGSGFPAAGAQETPSAGSAGTNAPSVTTGTAGSLTTQAGAWMPNFQSAQGWIQYVTAASLVKVSQAFFWYWTATMYIAASMIGSNYTFLFSLLYSFS